MYTFLMEQLKSYHKENGPIKIAIVGNGYIGGGILVETSNLKPHFFKPVVVIGRSIPKMDQLMVDCEGLYSYTYTDSVDDFQTIMDQGRIVYTNNIELLFQGNVDIILDCTGEPELGADIAIRALMNRIPICVSPELDIVAGAALQKIAREQKVVYSGFSGDEPGELMNLLSYVKLAGFGIVAAGKFKNFTDCNANPKSVEPWAIKFKQNPYKIASFADGSKMNMEMGLVANATGLVPDTQGMHCPEGTLETIPSLMCRIDQGGLLSEEGVIEIIKGAEPSGGVFVVGKNDNARLRDDLKYYKMGSGPNYLFYKFNHLCVFEMLIGAAKIILFKEPVIAALEKKTVDVVAIAKRNLTKGDALDDIGGFDYYGAVTKIADMTEGALLPIAFAKGLTVLCDIEKGTPIRLEDVSKIKENTLYKLWKNDSNPVEEV